METFLIIYIFIGKIYIVKNSRAAVVHLNFRAGSTFPVPALWTGEAGAIRLTRSDLMLHIGSIYFYSRGRGGA